MTTTIHNYFFIKKKLNFSANLQTIKYWTYFVKREKKCYYFILFLKKEHETNMDSEWIEVTN